MNLGTMEAKGDIILYRAADDHLMPGSLSVGQEAFAQKPNTTIAFGETIFFQDDPSVGTKETLALSEKRGFFEKRRIAQALGPRLQSS